MALGSEPEYKLTVSARIPSASGSPDVVEIDELVPVGSIGYGDRLRAEGEASVSVDPENLNQDIADRFKNLRATPCELNVFRGSQKMWRGPILSCQMQGPTLTLSARGMLYYLRYMTLESDLMYNSLTDQFEIGKGLVDAYQSLQYGNYGIDTSGITTSGITRVRRYPYIENQNVFARLFELAEVDDGFDIWVDPDTGLLHFSLHKGIDKSGLVFADESNIQNPNVFWSVTDVDIASDAIAVGVDDLAESPPVVGTYNDPSVRQSWGRSTHFATAEDVTTQTTINGYAKRIVTGHNDQLFVPGPTVVPVTDGEPSDFETGDIVTYSFNVGNIGLMNVQRRVSARMITIEEDGTEQIELELL